MKRRAAVVAALAAACLGLGAQTGAWRHYAGTINKTIRIEADIEFGEEELTGFYFYDKVGQPIALQGKAAFPSGYKGGGRAELTESDAEGKPTGIFSGTFSAGLGFFNGSWKSPDGKKSLALELKEDYSGSAALDVYTLIRSQAIDPDNPDSPEASFVALGLDVRGNAKFRAALSRELYEGLDAYACLEAKAMGFLADYLDLAGEDYRANPEDYSLNWESNRYLRPVFNARGILCLKDSYSEYTGGAHGTYYTGYYVFDIASGRRLGLESFVKGGPGSSLNALVARELRRQEGLKPNQALEEAGIFVAEADLPTDNFWVDGSGIYIHFPVYSIGPYAMGERTVYLSWKDLGNLSKGHAISKPRY
jgi:hypothetical protein